jgi:hypothetical protein
MRYTLILDGDIKQYYDDFVDSYEWYECTGCKKSANLWRKIRHTKKCPVKSRLECSVGCAHNI